MASVLSAVRGTDQAGKDGAPQGALKNLHDTWETVQSLRRTAQKTPPAVVDPFFGWSIIERCINNVTD